MRSAMRRFVPWFLICIFGANASFAQSQRPSVGGAPIGVDPNAAVGPHSGARTGCSLLMGHRVGAAQVLGDSGELVSLVDLQMRQRQLGDDAFWSDCTSNSSPRCSAYLFIRSVNPAYQLPHCFPERKRFQGAYI